MATDTLPREQSDELLGLIKSSDVFNLKQSDIAPKQAGGPPDVVTYHLSLSEGNRQKTLTFNGVTAPASVQPLLALLRKLALEQKRKGNG